MNIILNSNAIAHETEKALLIKIPNKDLKFWHPKTMVRQSGKRGYRLSVWFPNDNWQIKATRTSDKTRAVLATWTGSPSQAIKAFNLKLEGE